MIDTRLNQPIAAIIYVMFLITIIKTKASFGSKEFRPVVTLRAVWTRKNVEAPESCLRNHQNCNRSKNVRMRTTDLYKIKYIQNPLKLENF